MPLLAESSNPTILRVELAREPVTHSTNVRKLTSASLDGKPEGRLLIKCPQEVVQGGINNPRNKRGDNG